MDPCYFCQVVTDDTSAWNLVAQDALTCVALNGRQFEEGQCIVFPRRHAPTPLDLTAEEGAAIMAAATRVMQVMVEQYAPDGVLLYQNNGTGSGQEVPHFHLHVVPRRAGSDWGFGPPHIARLDGVDKPVRINHAAATNEKLATAEALRGWLSRREAAPDDT